jgi:hypothetical protein
MFSMLYGLYYYEQYDRRQGERRAEAAARAENIQLV